MAIFSAHQTRSEQCRFRTKLNPPSIHSKLRNPSTITSFNRLGGTGAVVGWHLYHYLQHSSLFHFNHSVGSRALSRQPNCSSPPPEPCNINRALRLEATIASDGLNASNNWLEVPMQSECFITFQGRCHLCLLLSDSTAYIDHGMLRSDVSASVADGLWYGRAFCPI